jgi:hypothetical protein
VHRLSFHDQSPFLLTRIWTYVIILAACSRNQQAAFPLVDALVAQGICGRAMRGIVEPISTVQKPAVLSFVSLICKLDMILSYQILLRWRRNKQLRPGLLQSWYIFVPHRAWIPVLGLCMKLVVISILANQGKQAFSYSSSLHDVRYLATSVVILTGTALILLRAKRTPFSAC